MGLPCHKGQDYVASLFPQIPCHYRLMQLQIRQRTSHDYILHLKLHSMQNAGGFPDKFHRTYRENLRFHRTNNFQDNSIHPQHSDIVETMFPEIETAL